MVTKIETIYDVITNQEDHWCQNHKIMTKLGYWCKPLRL